MEALTREPLCPSLILPSTEQAQARPRVFSIDPTNLETFGNRLGWVPNGGDQPGPSSAAWCCVTQPCWSLKRHLPASLQIWTGRAVVSGPSVSAGT